MSGRLHVENKLRFQTLFAPQISPSEWMVVQYVSDQPGVLSKDGHVPLEESHLAITEHLHMSLSLVGESTIVLIDPPPEFFHCLWEV